MIPKELALRRERSGTVTVPGANSAAESCPAGLMAVAVVAAPIAGRLLDIAGLRPAQNLVDQLGGGLEQSRDVWSVGNQTSGIDKTAFLEDGRQPRAKRA